MKRLLLIVATGISLSLQAQTQTPTQFFKVDGGIGAALTLGNLKSYGISASVEPKFFFTPQIAAGLRFEGDALFGGSFDGASAGSVDVSTSSRAAILLKGEYYFSENPNRFFVGLMAGKYALADVSGGSSGSASISAGNYFGVAPEIGFTMKNFRISGIYHIITGSDLVNISSGTPIEVGRNFLVIQIGFKLFQVEI